MGQGSPKAKPAALPPSQNSGDEPQKATSSTSEGSDFSMGDGPPMLKKSDFLPTTVSLHIYDVRDNLAMEYMNSVFRMLGTGAFHVAVEVCGDEWSYGFSDKTPGCTGVFNCSPGQNKEYGHHRETISMGNTPKTHFEIDMLLEDLEKTWAGEAYDLLRHNCCHFCDELCRKLGVGGIPGWIMNLAHVGSTISDGAWKVVDTPQHILFDTAKAGNHEPVQQTEPRASQFGKHYASKLDDDGELKVHTSSGRLKGADRAGAKSPAKENSKASSDEAPPRRCCCLSSKGSS